MLDHEDGPVDMEIGFAEALGSFYADSAAPLLWVEDHDLTADAERFLEAVDEIPAQGLDPSAYRTSVVQDALEELDGRADPRTAARAEILLSDALLRLAEALARGSDNPARAGLEWGIHRNRFSPESLLDGLAGGAQPEEALERLRPRLSWYEPMMDALASYREVAQSGGWDSVPEGRAVARGDSSATVAAVRARLAASPEEQERRLARRNAESSVYDASLAEAVALFQQRHGVAVDSIVGPSTIAAMNVPAAERVASLELNLDRLRRLPRDLGSPAIVVNVAGFELVVLEDQDVVMEMDVVVGQPEWRTSIFQGRLQYLVVNPYWHVPESIEAREVLPKAKEDTAYLSQEHLVVVREDDNFGPPVPLDSIDWAAVDSASFPYDFRQEPGPHNDLGRIKFMFPNEHAIYLHDTPADELFRRDYRAFSHGCIRVAEPKRLARYLLEHASDAPPERSTS